MKKTLTINGHNIRDIQSLFEEFNRVFMANTDWKLAPSLDALNDVLHGGYGAIESSEPVELVWQNMEQNRSDLGLEATRAWLQNKLGSGQFNQEKIAKDLAELEGGSGPTYFDIVLQIIADHPNIHLLPR